MKGGQSSTSGTQAASTHMSGASGGEYTVPHENRGILSEMPAAASMLQLYLK